ncbi:hypothetical protein [Candidatus Sororendozoicomonas aggregata]|uniref:hypothetical protein n=1 Tax=Candidatus Sororendozoicomonas aggregata TaxID=3073239 RepID=UPI002ED52F29
MFNVQKILDDRLYQLFTKEEKYIVDSVIAAAEKTEKRCTSSDLYNIVNELNRTLNVHLFRLKNANHIVSLSCKACIYMLIRLAYKTIDLSALYMLHYQCSERLNRHSTTSELREVIHNVINNHGIMASAWSNERSGGACIVTDKINGLYLNGKKYISTGAKNSQYIHILVDDPDYNGTSFICIKNNSFDKDIVFERLELNSFQMAGNYSIYLNQYTVNNGLFLGVRGRGEQLKMESHESGFNPGLLALGQLCYLLQYLVNSMPYIANSEEYHLVELKTTNLVDEFSRSLEDGSYFSLKKTTSFKVASTSLFRDAVIMFLPLFGPSSLVAHGDLYKLINNSIFLQNMGPANYQVLNDAPLSSYTASRIVANYC